MTFSSQAGLASIRVPADVRLSDDPKSWRERATWDRVLSYAVALDRIEDLVRPVVDKHAGNYSTHYESCWQYHAGCLAHMINTILVEERGHE